MSNDPRIEELLDRWEDLLDGGESISFEMFVADYCPEASGEVLDALKAKIEAIESMDEFLHRDHHRSSASNETRSITSTKDTQDELLHLKAGAEPIPGYWLVSPLGEGGFGEVWKALGPGGFHVALKFVRMDHKAAEPELRAIEITKNLRHPNLLSVFGTWQKAGWLIIASELAGKSLCERLQSLTEQGKTGIPGQELCSYMNDAAKAIDHLNKTHHPLGDGRRGSIQHRDIKPRNLLLSGGGIKVADFGIARFLEKHVTSHTGAMSVAYAAPEFFDGQTSSRSDQYSLAVTYCELRGGRLPFSGTDIQIMHGHVEGEPDLSMLPERERPVVLRALSKKPEDRWPTCRAFVRAIENADNASARNMKGLPPHSGDRGIGWFTLGTGVVLLLIVGAVWFGMQIGGKWNRDESRHLPGSPPTIEVARREVSVKGNGEKKTTDGESQTPTLPTVNHPAANTFASSSISPSNSDPPVVAPVPHIDTAVTSTRQLESAASEQVGLEKIREFIGHTQQVRSVAFSPDGEHVLSGGVDNIIRLWDVDSGVEVRYFRGHTVTVNSVAFSPDGSKGISGGQDDTVRVWDVASGKEIANLKAQGGVRHCAVSRDGVYVVAGIEDGQAGVIQVWNLGTREEVRRFKSRAPVWAVEFSPDGKRIASGGKDGRVEVRNFTTGAVRHIGSHATVVSSVRFIPNGRSLLTGGLDQKIRQWDSSSGMLLNEMHGSVLAISPNGRFCLCVGGGLRLWDLPKARLADFVQVNGANWVSIGPQGRHAVVSVGTVLQLWKLPSAREVSANSGLPTGQRREK